MNNKIILITGSTTGIGKAACIEFVKTDSSLVLVARDKILIKNIPPSGRFISISEMVKN